MIRLEDVCTFPKLLEAFDKTKKGKRHKKEVIEFESNLSVNLIEIQDELTKRKYQMNPYYSFTVYEPKERVIFACSYRDRVMIRWLCDTIVIPVLSNFYIYDNAACQKGKGVHFAQNRLKKHLRAFYKVHGCKGYILKCDISRYFPNVDQNILKKKLSHCGFDPDAFSLLEMIIDSFYQSERGKGIPLGNQTSQHFALFYLSSLDHYIKEQLKITYYTRYMDDFLLLHENKHYLQTCRNDLDNRLKRDYKLTFHEKTEIIPIKNGVEYLGFRFYLNKNGQVFMKLKKQSKERLRKNLNQRKQEFSTRLIEVSDLENYLASYEGHVKIGNTFNLMKKLHKKHLFVRR